MYIVETKPLERSTYMAVGHWCWFCWIPWIIVNFRWLKHPDAWWKKKSPHAWHLQKFPYKVLLWNWLLRIGIPSSTAAAKGKGWHIWHWLNEKRKIHMVSSFQHPTEIWDIHRYTLYWRSKRILSGLFKNHIRRFFVVWFSRFQTSIFFFPQKLAWLVVGQALISAKASWLRATWASAWHTFEKRRKLRVFGCKTQLERLWGNSSHLCTCIFNDASTSGFSDSPGFLEVSLPSEIIKSWQSLDRKGAERVQRWQGCELLHERPKPWRVATEFWFHKLHHICLGWEPQQPTGMFVVAHMNCTFMDSMFIHVSRDQKFWLLCAFFWQQLNSLPYGTSFQFCAARNSSRWFGHGHWQWRILSSTHPWSTATKVSCLSKINGVRGHAFLNQGAFLVMMFLADIGFVWSRLWGQKPARCNKTSDLMAM